MKALRTLLRIPAVILIITIWLNLHIVASLNVGSRKIRCSQPVGGRDTDALLDPKPTLPVLLGYAGAQAFLPNLAKCPSSAQIQFPWYSGDVSGGGICPPEYWDLGVSIPGLAIMGAAFALNLYANKNRLLITSTSLGVVKYDADITNEESIVAFEGITDWFLTPVGLVIKESSNNTKLFPLFWESKSVEALLKDRLDQEK